MKATNPVKSTIHCSVVILFALAGVLGATPTTLTNKEGNSLKATIIEATDTAVVVKRESDGVEFRIPLAQLNDASLEEIAKWREANKPDGIEMKIQAVDEKGVLGQLHFFLPDIKYDGQGKAVKGYFLRWDVPGARVGGSLEILIERDSDLLTSEAIGDFMDEKIAEWKDFLSPENIKDRPDAFKKREVNGKRFSGFCCQDAKQTRRYDYYLTDGTHHVNIVYINESGDGPIQLSEVDTIIENMDISAEK